jgi:hypothetical protein
MLMKTMLSAAVALTISGQALAQAPAQPSPTVDAQALGECLVTKSTGADRILVARWLLAALASAPQAAEVATVRPGQKMVFDKGMAALFTRMLTVDCAPESRKVFGAKTSEGFRVAGEALGRVAIQELLTNPQATAAIEEYVKYLNKDDFKAVVP